MAESHLDPKPRLRPKPSKPYFSPFLCRFLLVSVLLLLLALFPSQAPKSISQTQITKLWELLHLLFIGIAVSYGLFGRINSEPDAEIQPQLDVSRSCFSGIFHVSSILEDGYENPSGSDEKRLTQICRSLASPNGFSQTWNSQYFQGESLVFVSRENCVLDGWENPKSVTDFKPLNLPVRSLKSRVVDHDNSPESDSESSSRNSIESGDGKTGELNPTIFKENLEENVALPSPIPWRSRSISRMEVKEDEKTEKSQIEESQIEKSQIEESEIDNLKSQSFWSPIFSQTTSVNSPPKKASSPSPSSSSSPVSGRDQNPKMKATETEDRSCRASLQDWEAAPNLMPGESPLLSKNTRRFSIGSLSEVNSQRDGSEKLKNFSKSMRESINSSEMKVKEKPLASMKPLPRGKSVRTIRARENVPKPEKIEENNVDDQRLELSAIDVEKVEPETKSENVDDDSDEEEDEVWDLDDSELYSSEVDRKAGEFIAKFKEQIRLQKISSFRRSNGL